MSRKSNRLGETVHQVIFPCRLFHSVIRHSCSVLLKCVFYFYFGFKHIVQLTSFSIYLWIRLAPQRAPGKPSGNWLSGDCFFTGHLSFLMFIQQYPIEINSMIIKNSLSD